MHSPDEVNVGDKLLIYEPHKRVRHPATGKDFGKLTKVLGVLQITAKEPSGIVSGKVTISFDAIEKGSLVTTYEEPVLVYPPSETKAKDIAGYILEVRDTRTLNGQIESCTWTKAHSTGWSPATASPSIWS